jgi:hypothetical protein
MALLPALFLKDNTGYGQAVNSMYGLTNVDGTYISFVIMIPNYGKQWYSGWHYHG